MERTAIFPGSFDPFTVGHENIVTRGLKLYDKIIIAVGHNAAKRYYFSLEERVEFIRAQFANEARISVEAYDCLTVDFAIKKKADSILRGLRTAADFERSEEHTSELQSRPHLVCRLLLEKKKK